MSTASPLEGVRLLVPRRDDPRLTQTLRSLGAVCDEVQFTQRRAISGPELTAAMQALRRGDYDWVAVTSPFTLTALALLGHDVDLALAPGVRVAAVGPATAEAARRTGLEVALVGMGGGSALAGDWPEGAGRVLVPGAADSDGSLAAGLRARGWRVDQVTAYRTEPVVDLPAHVQAAWTAGHYSAWVATAGSMVMAAHACLPPPGPGLVTLGPSATRAGRRTGYRLLAEAEPTTLAALVETVVRVTAPH